MINKIDYDGLFAGNFRKFVSGGSLKLNLARRGLRTFKCRCCGIGETWNGLVLVLQIDHIDGDNANNSLNNLREICPNCHSQTATFSGKNSSHAGTAKGKILKYGDRKTYLTAIRDQYLEQNKDAVIALRAANIDFTKFGWVGLASKIIKVKPQKVRAWIEKCCPDLLNGAFERAR
jgi:RNA polymerase subunit RPABC4/transcription elongation factor Spt4